MLRRYATHNQGDILPTDFIRGYHCMTAMRSLIPQDSDTGTPVKARDSAVGTPIICSGGILTLQTTERLPPSVATIV